MARLYSSLLDGSGRRYYFGLDSAPGGITPAVVTLRVTGLVPTIFTQVEVFRTPAPAVITVNGRQVQTDVPLVPSVAALAVQGRAPTLLTQLMVTNALPPDYTDLPSNPPAILFINTVTPAPAVITLSGLLPNASPGGDIGFVTPGVGLITLQSLQYTLIFLEGGAGMVNVLGRAPTVVSTLLVSPEVGTITVNGRQVSSERPFQWIDVSPPPALTWTTTR